jgi:phosphatidate cytidylyltransferase
MAYLDTSDQDDRPGDRAGRRPRAARPAWDAATYGTPEDLRGASPPSRGRSRPVEPPPVRYPDEIGLAYPAAPDRYSYEPEPSPPSRYTAPESYLAPDLAPASYRAPPSYREAESYASPEPYDPTDLYPPEPYAPAESYAGDESFAGTRNHATPTYPDQAYRADQHGSGPYPQSGDSYQDYPGGIDDDRRPAAPAGKSRAGRDLPAAIGVGVGLAGLALISLFVWRPAFLGVCAVAIGIGIWELVRAIRTSGANPPLIPLVIGGVLMTGLGWWGQADALTFGLVVTVLAAMVWRLADGVIGYGRDITAATLVAVYVPFLAGFAALLASPDDGGLRVLVTLACVVLSDTGGYIAGVLFGKHPMAPSVSPKKSWEGLAGSLVATAIGSGLLLLFVFDVSLVWGVTFGLAVSVASVLGDLGESMIKRDLGVKDMSNLLPGHGGLMDRLDSIVFAAPTAYGLFMLMAPPL